MRWVLSPEELLGRTGRVFRLRVSSRSSRSETDEYDNLAALAGRRGCFGPVEVAFPLSSPPDPTFGLSWLARPDVQGARPSGTVPAAAAETVLTSWSQNRLPPSIASPLRILSVCSGIVPGILDSRLARPWSSAVDPCEGGAGSAGVGGEGNEEGSGLGGRRGSCERGW
jgi:hypothetical protein